MNIRAKLIPGSGTLVLVAIIPTKPCDVSSVRSFTEDSVVQPFVLNRALSEFPDLLHFPNGTSLPRPENPAREVQSASFSPEGLILVGILFMFLILSAWLRRPSYGLESSKQRKEN